MQSIASLCVEVLDLFVVDLDRHNSIRRDDSRNLRQASLAVGLGQSKAKCAVPLGLEGQGLSEAGSCSRKIGTISLCKETRPRCALQT